MLPNILRLFCRVIYVVSVIILLTTSQIPTNYCTFRTLQLLWVSTGKILRVEMHFVCSDSRHCCNLVIICVFSRKWGECKLFYKSNGDLSHWKCMFCDSGWLKPKHLKVGHFLRVFTLKWIDLSQDFCVHLWLHFCVCACGFFLGGVFFATLGTHFPPKTCIQVNDWNGSRWVAMVSWILADLSQRRSET